MQEQKEATLEEEKVIMEIRKLEIEIASIRRRDTRQMITMISVLVGIVVSGFSILTALQETNYRNKKLAMEAELQSHNLFLNTILDRIGRVKFHYLEQKEGELKEVRQERYGVASQQTAYVAAFSLAKRFKELRPAAMTALKEQASGTKSPQAAKLLM